MSADTTYPGGCIASRGDPEGIKSGYKPLKSQGLGANVLDQIAEQAALCGALAVARDDQLVEAELPKMNKRRHQK
jgi:hypothetical protein